jgi:peptide/nickel transport system substrate-binding protein
VKKGLILCFVIAMALFAGCSTSNSQAPTKEQAETQKAPSETPKTNSGEPKAGGEIKVALQSDGKSLDPHKATDAASMHLIENMYSTLMQYTDTYGEVEPGLANEFNVSEDNKTYTFKLLQGVKFHKSEKEVTSEDVKYSIERIISSEIRAEQFAAVEKIETPDAYTVVFQLKESVSPFLTYLAYPMNAIVNKEVVEANNGGLDQVDAGSGPFQLVEWKKDQQLVLEKNPNYFEENKPYLDKVIFKPIPDETARTTALRNKEVDMILDTSAKEVKVLEKADHIEITSVPGTFWEYIGLNNAKPALEDVRVRQAIAHAVDREMINKIVKFGRAMVLEGGNIPPGHWADADLHIYPKRDVEKAKQLLKEAGKESGLKLTLKVGSAFQYQVDAAQMIKQQLKDVGVEVEVLAQESGVFFDALGKGDFEMTIVGWLGFVDPDEYTYNLFHTGAKWNQQAYSNPEVDALLEKGRTTFDQAERKEIYTQIQKIIAEEAPMVFLYVNEQTSAYLKDVKGFVVHPTVTTLSLKKTWLDR